MSRQCWYRQANLSLPARDKPARIIILTQNPKTDESTIKALQEAAPKVEVAFVKCNLGSFVSVQGAANRFSPPLNVSTSSCATLVSSTRLHHWLKTDTKSISTSTTSAMFCWSNRYFHFYSRQSSFTLTFWLSSLLMNVDSTNHGVLSLRISK